MKRTWALTSTNLGVLWRTPVPYVAGVVLHLVLGVLGVDQLRAREQALVQPLVPLAGFLVLALVPLLTMRALAEERRAGTLDVLRAVPVPPGPIVAGKFLASWITALAVAAPVAMHVFLLDLFGDPDVGVAVSGAIGLALLAAAACGIGLLTSATTRSQPVAAVVAFFVSLVLWFAHLGAGSVANNAVLAHLSLSERLRSFAGGGISTPDAGHLAAVALGCCAAAAIVLGGRRSAAAVLGGALVLAVASDRAGGFADLTADHTLTLTTTTVGVVEAVDAPVAITAFLRRDEAGRAEVAGLLDRYERLNRAITSRLVDPLESPGEARRLGVDPALGGVVLEGDGDRQLAATPTEADITAALVRLERDTDASICVGSGHGELDPASTLADGLSVAAGLWQGNGYEVLVVDLLVEPSVPAVCDALVVALPTVTLGRDLDVELAHWLEAGGRLLLLTDPLVAFDPGALLEPYGLGIDTGIVVEGDPASRYPDDASAPVISRFSSANPIVARLPPVLLPVTQAVTVADRATGAGGLEVTALARTSEASTLERPDGTTAAGPVVVLAAAEQVRVPEGDAAVVRTRIVVAGDADLFTNSIVGEAANGELVVRVADWLTLEDSLAISTNLARDRPLELTEARRGYALALTAGIVPGLFLLAGGLVWAVRRGR